MMPFKKIGPCTLYLGDAMQIIPALVEEGFQADLILTDPPYLLTSGGKSGLMRGIFAPEEYDNGGNFFEGEIPDWAEFMPLLFAALKDPGHCYTMANNRNVQAMLNAGEIAKFHFHNLLEWKKGTYVANRWYMKGTEFIGFFGKGKAFAINDCSSRGDIYVPQVDESKHPTEKPVALMQHYIENSSQPGDTVFDPFAGSASTGVAAMRAGRKFIGIEKDEKFFDMAVTRLTAQRDSFQQVLF